MERLFGVDKIDFDDIEVLQHDVPNIIVWAAPVMFLFVLIEYIISSMQEKHYYNNREALGSLLVGIGNVAIGVVIKTFLFYIFVLIYNLVPWRMELRWWTFIPCYIIFDFCSYWAHRISHHLTIFWATHVVHHSGEHYNLTVSFRLSWIQYFKIIFFFPVAFIGFHPIVIFVTNQIAVLFQFWAHTEYIRRLHPVIEYIFATPSNHRVHHGSQEKYLNKNFGATFIIWDRIFGTYQKEEDQVIYGITTNIKNKINPLLINFHECVDIIKDVKAAKSIREKCFYLFGDPAKIALRKQQTTRKNKSMSHTKITRKLNTAT
jgi:sterol desaturase/sphingolipid hydroxylase (fatty acid hydroxylase superfamily)